MNNTNHTFKKPNFNAVSTPKESNSFDDEFFGEFTDEENETKNNTQSKPAVAATPKAEVKQEVKQDVKPVESVDKNDNDWMTFPEGADILGISHTTFRAMWREDKLPVFKLSKRYLIKRADFKRLVESHMTVL